MTRKLACRVFFPVTMLLATLPAQALTANLPEIQIHGFASVYAVATDNNHATYKDTGRDVSFEPDTMAGLQFMMPVNERVSFTLQMITKAERDYELDAEWAYATFKLTDQVDLRVGRLRVPFFNLSESLEVGYSYPWVRPPIDVYGQMSFTEFSGIDSLVHVPLDDGEFVIHPFYGAMTPEADMGGQPASGDITVAGINIQYLGDWWGLHLSHSYSEISLDSAALSGLTANVAPVGTQTLETLMYAASGGNRDVSDQFAMIDREALFTGVGFEIDRSGIKLMGDYTRRESKGFVSDVDSWYLMAGYRIGQWMPHLTFSGLKTRSDYDDALAAVPALATGNGPVADAMLQGAVRSIIQSNTVNQDSVTVGVRYDVMPKVALKAEWQRITPEEGSSMISIFEGAGTDGPGKLDDVNLFSAGVDLVF